MEHKILKVNGVETSKSRTMVLIKEDLKYTRLYELENDLNSLIIIKIELENCDSVILISGYRQWRLPAKINLNNKSCEPKLKKKFKTYLECIKKALGLGLDVICLQDTNIDTSPNNNHNIKYNIRELYNIFSISILRIISQF